MYMSTNGVQMAEYGSTATLGPPPSYSANASELSLNDRKTRSTKTTNKASASTSRFDTDASTIFSTAETLVNRLPAGRVLTRGLQVPTRHHSPTSGYPYPEVLFRARVTPGEWSVFTRDVRKHASLSKSQWAATLAGGCSFAILGSVVMGGFAVIPAAIYGTRMRKVRERLNFAVADSSGALAQCVARWNKLYFRDRGLAVRVDIPGRSRDMEQMDLSSSKLYKYQQMNGHTYHYSSYDKSSQLKESHERMKASKRARIVIIPLDHRHKPILGAPRIRVAFPGLDGAQDDESTGLETEGAKDDVSVVERLLPKRDAYPDEPKP